MRRMLDVYESEHALDIAAYESHADERERLEKLVNSHENGVMKYVSYAALIILFFVAYAALAFLLAGILFLFGVEDLPGWGWVLSGIGCMIAAGFVDYWLSDLIFDKPHFRRMVRLSELKKNPY